METMKSVQVVLPIVKMRPEDLAYLRGLMDQGPKCSIPYKFQSRLLVLGLAEEKELPPCPKETRKWARADGVARRTITREMGRKEPNWDTISRVVWEAKRGEPRPRKQFTITKAGVALIRKGITQVQIQKGCK